MAENRAADVKKLRDTTGAGMMDCKKALTESNGDFDAAVDYLRKKGAKVAELRAGRDANEGVVYILTSPDNKFGIMVQVGCETDFVSKNESFVSFAKSIAELALNNKILTNALIMNTTYSQSSIAHSWYITNGQHNTKQSTHVCVLSQSTQTTEELNNAIVGCEACNYRQASARA